jgi:hypothetical protein
MEGEEEEEDEEEGDEELHVETKQSNKPSKKLIFAKNYLHFPLRF